MRRGIERAAHILRIGASVIGFGLATTLPERNVALKVALEAGAAFAIFMAVFSFNHDLMHGSLGIRRALNEVLIGLAGIMMLMSGHGIRQLHLRHHARLLADDDLEGLLARYPWWRAVLEAPFLALRMRLEAYRSASPRERSWQRAETAVNLLFLSSMVVFGLRSFLVFAVVAVVLQASMPVWAGYIPHRAPGWLVQLARGFIFTRSPIVLSLVFHEHHHERPRVPCHQLADLAVLP